MKSIHYFMSGLSRFQSSTACRPRATLAVLGFLLCLASSLSAQTNSDPNEWNLDHRYSPPWWQTAFCLPDDWQKSLVGKEGELLYDYSLSQDFAGKKKGFATKLSFVPAAEPKFLKQELLSARVPVVRTFKRAGEVEILEETFAVAPLTPSLEKNFAAKTNSARNDVLLASFRNSGRGSASLSPELRIETRFPVVASADHKSIRIGETTRLDFPEPFAATETSSELTVVHFPEINLKGHAEKKLTFGIARGMAPGILPHNVHQAEALRHNAVRFWEKVDLPYGRMTVPDPNVQALLDSCIRNIYQAREIKNGLPAFQVGPTCYRGLWVVDGSFLLEAMSYLGCTNETRSGIKYLMSFQKEDGSWLLLRSYWKETGIALWAITRHAKLTNDKEWLRQNWPAVERGFAFIRQMREIPDAAALNARLIPDGYSDGGLNEKSAEYTNIYWTMAGLRAAVEAARWLGNPAQADAWQKEFDDFYQTFRRAAERDTHTDAQGNRYVPIKMNFDPKVSPQKAQWGFMHAVFPGKVFAADDPLVRGNMAMLRAVEAQGLVCDTGWFKNGIWTYFGSFYAHAWLWLGDGEKAARTLYAFGNHASPLLCWREEQALVGGNEQIVGDMPHNWASAEFIRLVRHALVLERGNDLHLLEAMPPTWAHPGAKVELNKILTEFGEISLTVNVAKNGKTATLHLTPPRRNPAQRVILHLGTWSGESGTLELPADKPSTRKIQLHPK